MSTAESHRISLNLLFQALLMPTDPHLQPLIHSVIVNSSENKMGIFGETYSSLATQLKLPPDPPVHAYAPPAVPSATPTAHPRLRTSAAAKRARRQ